MNYLDVNINHDEEYEIACKLDYVNDPLAFALYQTWRKYDSYYKERCVKNDNR